MRQTPLLYAVWDNDPVIVKMLLEKGAQPDFRIQYGFYRGESPLSAAQDLGFTAVLNLLQSCVLRK